MSNRNKSRMSDKNQDMFQTADIVDILDKINSFVSISDVGETAPEQISLVDYTDRESLKTEGFGEAQIVEILRGHQQGVDVRRFAKQEYNWMQMRELRFGLAQNVDISYYENPMFSASQMHEIRFGLVTNLDVESYAKLYLSTTDMSEIRKKLYAKSYSLNPKQYGRTIHDDATGLLLRFKEDCLMAFLTLPKKPKTKITMDDVMNLLEERYVVYGIKQDKIAEMLEKNITEKEICIANGKAPTHGKNGWYELNFDNGTDKKTFLKPDNIVDYSDVNTVESATLGQILVKYHPAETKVSGMTVSGIPIEGVPGRELPLLHGTGFKYNPKKKLYYATKKGYPSFDSVTWSLNVWDVYQINGDVSYYQSVEYNGSIHIHGNVRSLATVRATGDIIVDGFIEGASLFSDHDIVIKGGVNGGGKGVISAGGHLKGNFFENANLKAKGPVEANYFLNCDIKTDERVIAHGKKARIMGGRVTAAISVEAVIVGNHLGVRTIFTVGDIADIDHRLLELNKALNAVTEQLTQLKAGKERLELLLGEGNTKSNPLYEKTMLALTTLKAQEEDLSREIERLNSVCSRAEKAYIKVHGELQEGVVFIINGNRKTIGKTITSGITLTKEKTKGR